MSIWILILAAGCGRTDYGGEDCQSFEFDAVGIEEVPVPGGCTNVEIAMWGAGGGRGGTAFYPGGTGGGGAFVGLLLAVEAGTIITVGVGGAGKNGISGAPCAGGGGGGGASFALLDGALVGVAGGGGGGPGGRDAVIDAIPGLSGSLASGFVELSAGGLGSKDTVSNPCTYEGGSGGFSGDASGGPGGCNGGGGGGGGGGPGGAGGNGPICGASPGTGGGGGGSYSEYALRVEIGDGAGPGNPIAEANGAGQGATEMTPAADGRVTVTFLP